MLPTSQESAYGNTPFSNPAIDLHDKYVKYAYLQAVKHPIFVLGHKHIVQGRTFLHLSHENGVVMFCATSVNWGFPAGVDHNYTNPHPNGVITVKHRPGVPAQTPKATTYPSTGRHSLQSPNTSAVCPVRVNPCLWATSRAQRSTGPPSISTVRPHSVHTR